MSLCTYNASTVFVGHTIVVPNKHTNKQTSRASFDIQSSLTSGSPLAASKGGGREGGREGGSKVHLVTTHQWVTSSCVKACRDQDELWSKLKQTHVIVGHHKHQTDRKRLFDPNTMCFNHDSKIRPQTNT